MMNRTSEAFVLKSVLTKKEKLEAKYNADGLHQASKLQSNNDEQMIENMSQNPASTEKYVEDFNY